MEVVEEAPEDLVAEGEEAEEPLNPRPATKRRFLCLPTRT